MNKKIFWGMMAVITVGIIGLTGLVLFKNNGVFFSADMSSFYRSKPTQINPIKNPIISILPVQGLQLEWLDPLPACNLSMPVIVVKNIGTSPSDHQMLTVLYYESDTLPDNNYAVVPAKNPFAENMSLPSIDPGKHLMISLFSSYTANGVTKDFFGPMYKAKAVLNPLGTTAAIRPFVLVDGKQYGNECAIDIFGKSAGTPASNAAPNPPVPAW